MTTLEKVRELIPQMTPGEKWKRTVFPEGAKSISGRRTVPGPFREDDPARRTLALLVDAEHSYA